jgi:hypothetical protein
MSGDTLDPCLKLTNTTPNHEWPTAALTPLCIFSRQQTNPHNPAPSISSKPRNEKTHAKK